MKISEFLGITENLMYEKGVPIRDTWSGFDGYNLDDYHTNNQNFGGPRHFRIEHKMNGYIELKRGMPYEVPGYQHAAYDNYYIIVPKRLEAIVHPVIHECVHYLQASTTQTEAQYINFTGTNPLEYLTQKCELEAHYVQFLYIIRHEKEILSNFNESELPRIADIFENNSPYEPLVLNEIIKLKVSRIF